MTRFARWMVARWVARPLEKREVGRFRLGIVKLDRIGDAILALGAIRFLVARYGSENTVLFVTAQVELLMKNEFPGCVVRVLPMAVMHRKLWHNRKSLRKELSGITCEEVVCLRHYREDWDEVVLSLIGARRTWILDSKYMGEGRNIRRSYYYRRASRVAGDQIQREESGCCGEINRHATLLSMVAGKTIQAEELLPQITSVQSSVVASDIVVAPISSLAIKDLPKSRVLAAARYIRDITNEAIVLCGDEGQRGALESLASAVADLGVKNVSCNIDSSLMEFIRRVSRAKLVLAADTAAAHIATALDRPTVVLIGGGHPGEFGPWYRSKRQVWLTNELPCFGCNWDCRHPEAYCITKVSEQSIASAIFRVLEERREGR